MKNFKIGELVQTNEFNDDPKRKSHGLYFNSNMVEYVGKSGIITSINGISNCDEQYAEVHDWNWPLSALTEVETQG